MKYLSKLTPSELVIAEKIAWGLTKKEIAKELCNSVHTINNHLANIYSKLDINKESDLTRFFFIDKYDIPVCPIRKEIMRIISIVVFIMTFAVSVMTRENMPRRAVRSARKTTRKETLI